MQQSELALFAQEFRRVLAPLFSELLRAHECLRSAGDAPRLPLDVAELRETLAHLSGELSDLAARVERERAGVFVFGPPKGGKSTLLDALAGARVSEVSILPGYPCVLRAAHGREESVALQRFDGSLEVLGDPGALRVVLQRAHAELVASVRAARARGEAFDAARHLQGAVRRVERTLPAEPLARAALELVECPSVHAPLFPSYGEMRIGEPEQSSVAVFVLRAAQLADEATFDGIEELLTDFARPILVVNLDERGRELSRAGEIAASLEREDPARLIAAFEELSTCGPLAQAVRERRVPVLALDLLEAARGSLHGGEPGPASAARQRARFEDLEREIAAVLDGHEVFRALAHSAVRRALELAEEARELAATPGLAELVRRRDAAQRERAALAAELDALARLVRRARALWEAEELFDGLRARLFEATAAHAAELARALEAPLARAIEDWFADSSSLQELIDARLAPRLDAARGELARGAERRLREELKRAPAGALSDAARTDLGEARVALESVLGPCVERVRLELEPMPLRALGVESIPVRPRLGERLTWRRAAEVRRRLFGPPEAPGEPVTSATKARRLGSVARAALLRSAIERARASLAEEARRVSAALGEALLATFTATLREHVARERARLEAPTLEIEARVAELAALATAFEVLEPACARAQTGLNELAERFEPVAELVPAARLAPRDPAERAARASLSEREPSFE